MPTPTFSQWRTLTQPAPGLPRHSLRERQLAAWATYLTGTNPDGSSRATGLLPPPPVSGYTAWYDSTRVTTAGVISSWADSSGNNNTLTPSATGPTLVSAGINFLPTLSFTNNRMQVLSALTGASAFTVFAVAQSNETNPAVSRWLVEVGNQYGGAQVTGRFDFVMRGVADLQGGPMSSTPHVWEMDGTIPGTATATLRIDNIQTATGSGVMHAQGAVTYVGDVDDFSGPWVGLIGEVIFYNTQLSPANINSVYQYLKAKWGTP